MAAARVVCFLPTVLFESLDERMVVWIRTHTGRDTEYDYLIHEYLDMYAIVGFEGLSGRWMLLKRYPFARLRMYVPTATRSKQRCRHCECKVYSRKEASSNLNLICAHGRNPSEVRKLLVVRWLRPIKLCPRVGAMHWANHRARYECNPRFEKARAVERM